MITEAQYKRFGIHDQVLDLTADQMKLKPVFESPSALACKKSDPRVAELIDRMLRRLDRLDDTVTAIQEKLPPPEEEYDEDDDDVEDAEAGENDNDEAGEEDENDGDGDADAGTADDRGIVFIEDEDGRTLVSYDSSRADQSYTITDESYTIPVGVTKIGNDAFPATCQIVRIGSGVGAAPSGNNVEESENEKPEEAPTDVGTFKFRCPFCGQKLEAEEGWQGERTECPRCHKLFDIPEPPPKLQPPQIMAASDGESGSDDGGEDGNGDREYTCPYCGRKKIVDGPFVGLHVRCECGRSFPTASEPDRQDPPPRLTLPRKGSGAPRQAKANPPPRLTLPRKGSGAPRQTKANPPSCLDEASTQLNWEKGLAAAESMGLALAFIIGGLGKEHLFECIMAGILGIPIVYVVNKLFMILYLLTVK